ncbi:MAG: hypothetical protein AB7P23_05660 [Amphiplicatus sp.]
MRVNGDNCSDGQNAEMGAALEVASCTDHGTVTIVGHRRNGERIFFQLGVADMVDYLNLLGEACEHVVEAMKVQRAPGPH